MSSFSYGSYGDGPRGVLSSGHWQGASTICARVPGSAAVLGSSEVEKVHSLLSRVVDSYQADTDRRACSPFWLTMTLHGVLRGPSMH